MKDKQLLEKCLKFTKNLNMLLESESDQVKYKLHEIKEEKREFPIWDETEYLKDLQSKGAFGSPFNNPMEDPDFPDHVKYNWDYSGAKRRDYVKKYSWSIITRKALIKVLKLVGHKLFSVGAGSGYIEHELKKLGAKIVATSLPEKDDPYNHVRYTGSKVGFIDSDANTAIMRFANDRVLLFSWPSYSTEETDWTDQALELYTVYTKRNKLVFIGEDCEMGCTGSSRFHKILETFWNRIPVRKMEYDHNGKYSSRINIPSWNGIADSIIVYQLKTDIAMKAPEQRLELFEQFKPENIWKRSYGEEDSEQITETSQFFKKMGNRWEFNNEN